jgi:hypothetical protein
VHARMELLRAFEESSTARIAARVYAQQQAARSVQYAASVFSPRSASCAPATPHSNYGALFHGLYRGHSAAAAYSPHVTFQGQGASMQSCSPAPHALDDKNQLPTGSKRSARVSFDAVHSPRSSAPAPVTPHPVKGQLHHRSASPLDSDDTTPRAGDNTCSAGSEANAAVDGNWQRRTNAAADVAAQPDDESAPQSTNAASMSDDSALVSRRLPALHMHSMAERERGSSGSRVAGQASMDSGESKVVSFHNSYEVRLLGNHDPHCHAKHAIAAAP